MKPTVMIVGHGTVSGQKSTINYGNCSIIFPIPEKEPFSLTSHNMIVKRLSNAESADTIENELEFLASLPTTRVVRAAHKLPMFLPSEVKDMDISSKGMRTEIYKLLSEVEQAAVSSNQAWEIFEYKISTASDILSSKFAFLPDKGVFEFFPLFCHGYIEHKFTLNVFLKTQLVLQQVDELDQTGQTTGYLSADNFVYMTPTNSDAKSSSQMSLSDLLALIPEVCILVAKHGVGEDAAADDEQDVSLPSAKKAKLGGSSIEMIFMEEFRTHELFSEHKQEVEAEHSNTLWYELYLPDDSNVIIGACGDEDSSF
jgi:hypothetical protein